MLGRLPPLFKRVPRLVVVKSAPVTWASNNPLPTPSDFCALLLLQSDAPTSGRRPRHYASLKQSKAINCPFLLSLGPPPATGHYLTSSVCSGTNCMAAVAPQPGAVVPTMLVSMSSPLAGVVQTVAAPVMFAPQGSSYFVPSIGSYRNGGFVYKGITYGPGQYHNPPLCETGYIEDYDSESSYPDDESDARSTSTYVSNATLGGYRG